MIDVHPVPDDRLAAVESRQDAGEAILEAWSVYFDRDSDRRLSWQPHTAVASRCEDVGYTLGDYSTIAPAADDGAWRVVADAGTPPLEVTDE